MGNDVTNDQLGRGGFEALLCAADLAPFADALEAGHFEALLPGLRAELDRAQRTRWHALTILRHSVATASIAGSDFETRVTGLLHDLGKQACCAINARGEESYLGHAERGAALAEPYLVALGFDDATRERITRRIARHMDLHFAGHDAHSAKSLDKVIERLGPDLPALAELAMADTATMHPAIVAEKLAEHAALRERLATRAAERGDIALSAALRAIERAAPHPWAAAAVAAGTAFAAEDPAIAAARRDATEAALAQRLGLWPVGRTKMPVLLLTCGLPASGKSVLARRVAADVASVAHIASDAVRMALTDDRPTYSGPESMLVHGTVGRLARRLLAADCSVIVDATGIKPRDRRASLEAASETGARTAIAWCEVDEATATTRLARRAARFDPLDRSEADAAIRARMATVATPPTADEADLVIRVTPESFEAGVTELVAIVGSADAAAA